MIKEIARIKEIENKHLGDDKKFYHVEKKNSSNKKILKKKNYQKLKKSKR